MSDTSYGEFVEALAEKLGPMLTSSELACLTIMARKAQAADILRDALTDQHAYLRRLEDGAVGGVCRAMFESVRARRLAAGQVLGEAGLPPPPGQAVE